MKRIAAIFVLLCAVFLWGCEKREYGILDYQNNNIEAECIVNGKYKVVLKKEENSSTITVKEPKEAENIFFEITDDRIFAISGETKIELNREELKGVCALAEIFSQSEECLTQASEKGKESVLTFETNQCIYVITLGENSVPKNVKITSENFQYDVEICSVKLN